MSNRRFHLTLSIGIMSLTTIACNQGQEVTSPRSANVSPALADAPAPIKPTWLSKQEAERLNQSDSSNEIDKLDAFVVMAAGTEGEERARRVAATALMLKVMLHRLFYEVDIETALHPSDDPKFYAALAEFEQRAGLTQDGVFSGADMEQLRRLSSLADYYDLNAMPLGQKFISQQEGYIHARGSWIIQGEKLAAPVNVTQIDCWRSFGNCIISDAELQPPTMGFGGSSSYVSSDVSYWDITSWSPTRVIAEQTTVCRRLVLTVDVKAQQAFHVASDLNAEGCSVVGKLPAPRVTTLEDGVSVGLDHYKDVWSQLEKVSKLPRQRLQQLLAEPQKSTAGAPDK